MVKQTIQIFARIKPTKKTTGLYEITEDEGGGEVVSFIVPKQLNAGLVNNKKENHKFSFQKIFDQNTKQDEVFNLVSKPVINNVLEGYNGTIFAYGQTSSGKTFTVTGGPKRYTDRGIIPRTLSYIFEYYKQNSEFVYQTYVSYLEIYNENGYDLLDPKHEAEKLEDLPKVLLLEDTSQNIHLKNLSTQEAANEEEALNLLFMGDTNRMIAETPMNQASTRSHCIFTIHITSREAGSATIKRSKLHLVDLAGSERVSKTGVNGVLLNEAKYINLSLHYLEQVIVALAEKTRQHIPYRNSMMTSVLRDSLGGNCMTTMIATCSVESSNISESISTCNFAQRVALIKNDATLNEELDPRLVIVRLKQEVNELKAELAMVTGIQRTDKLSDEDFERCQQAVDNYLKDTDPEVVIETGNDMRRINHCFKLMKKRILNGAEKTPAVISSPKESISEQEMTKMKDLLLQRDNEITILVKMLKREKMLATGPGCEIKIRDQERIQAIADMTTAYVSNLPASAPASAPSTSDVSMSQQTSKTTMGQVKPARSADKVAELSVARQQAFDDYKRRYADSSAIDDNKKTLKQRYLAAKKLGQSVNTARLNILKLKELLNDKKNTFNGSDSQEIEIRKKLELEKNSYKSAFDSLKELKHEIEHLQYLLENSKLKLMKDFEKWWNDQTKTKMKISQQAWQTPPQSILSSSQSSASLSKVSSHRSQESIKASNVNIMSSRDKTFPDIPLTGDSQADADILAFLKARQTLVKKGK